MDARHGLRLTTLAAVVAALSLAACDKPATDTTARRTEPMTATTPATEAKEKIAAATDKMATAVEDSTLTAKVKAALLAEPGLSSLQISVETKNGAVTLSGSVDTAASKDRAKEVASKIEGVAMVVDQMTVKSS